jgi:hypothetical protein
VTDHLGADSLSTTRHVVLVLRLVLTPGKRQLKGDVVDPETGWSRPFLGVSGLTTVVERWLDGAGGGPGDDGHRDPPE